MKKLTFFILACLFVMLNFAGECDPQVPEPSYTEINGEQVQHGFTLVSEMDDTKVWGATANECNQNLISYEAKLWEKKAEEAK